MSAQATRTRTLTVPATAAAERAPEPCVMIIFGASGDLTRRMLLPALYDLALDRRLPPRFAVVGFARTNWSDEDFRQHAKEAASEFSRRPVDEAVWNSFAENLFFVPGQYADLQSHERMSEALAVIERERGTGGNHLYYLAVPPTAFPDIIRHLQLRQHAKEGQEQGGWSRVIVEKPFGEDLKSALELNRILHSVFPEDEIYRIDHYLGKETVQNILVFRFANGIFEPIWNRNYVDHIQITVAESIGVGTRGSYYDGAGALRDIIQNHGMQLLSLTAMEPPIAFNGQAVRNEKVKVLHAIRHLDGLDVMNGTARGQYGPGWVAGEEVPGYRQEQGVSPESTTETYVALRMFIDNWRWADVPVYLRTGKRLPKRSTEVAIQFKRAPHLLFREFADLTTMEANVLSMRIQPNEGISIKFLTKVPGAPIRIRAANMDFLYGASFLVQAPSAYETLLVDALRGDATLFTRADEVEAAWSLMTPVLQAWADAAAPEFPNYEAGTWGPEAADQLIERDGREWRRL